MEAKLYTLVTGGSQGIGEAMAIECAKRGHNLLLVALPGPELENTAGMIIEKYGIDVKTFPVDLTDFTGPESVYKWCESNNYKVNFLINNAGIAGTAIFEKSSIEYSDQRILLNIRALVLLTRYFIPMFRAHGDNCYILNIGYYRIVVNPGLDLYI